MSLQCPPDGSDLGDCGEPKPSFGASLKGTLSVPQPLDTTQLLVLAPGKCGQALGPSRTTCSTDDHMHVFFKGIGEDTGSKLESPGASEKSLKASTRRV